MQQQEQQAIILENSWGTWGAAWRGDKVTAIYLPGSLPPGIEDLFSRDNPLLVELNFQLQQFLVRKRKVFSLPFSLQGSHFQLQTWQFLQEIPYGQTATYGEVAEKMGSIKKARAVGGACNKNRLPLIIPCHRVVGSGGRLVGFGGGLELKRKLLELEGGINGRYSDFPEGSS